MEEGKEGGRDRERKKENPFVHSPNACINRSGIGHSEVPGTPSWFARVQIVGLSFTAFPNTLDWKRSGLDSNQHSGVLSGVLNKYAFKMMTA